MFKNILLNLSNIISKSNTLLVNSNKIFTSALLNRDVIDRKEMLRSLPKVDEGTVGEKSIDIDLMFGK